MLSRPIPGRPMPGSRIAVIDDQDAVRRALGEMLDAYGYVVELHESAEAFLADPVRGGVSCVISDVRMPGMDGIDLVRALVAAQPAGPPVVLISGQADIAMAVTALKAGAADFIEKPVDDVRLVAAINRAIAQFASASGPGSGPASAPAPALDTAELTARFQRLTAREVDVFDLVALGHTSASIAANLGISARTVEGYRAQIMEKLRITSVAAIVRLAIRLGRVTP